ncbi:MAG TPA: hypothetical protein VKZ96_11735 [Thermomicrobiales bacterium]|nr:hypothetical protein [Thermomicrobiales bacterium]
MSLLRWLRSRWQDVCSPQSYELQEANPPLIRQRLDRYTNS